MAEIGVRQGANHSEVGHLARIRNASMASILAIFQQRISDSGH